MHQPFLCLQGMEKSHWRAKSIYMRHTQHDGGRERHSALRQMLEFEYRLMTHRLRVAAVAEARSELKRLREIRSEKYKQIWLASIAPERAAEWRAGKRRDGSRWVPIASEEEDLVEEVEEAASTSLDDGMAGDLNVDDLEAELMSQEASLYADGLVLEEQVIAA